MKVLSLICCCAIFAQIVSSLSSRPGLKRKEFFLFRCRLNLFHPLVRLSRHRPHVLIEIVLHPSYHTKSVPPKLPPFLAVTTWLVLPQRAAFTDAVSDIILKLLIPAIHLRPEDGYPCCCRGNESEYRVSRKREHWRRLERRLHGPQGEAGIVETG